MLAMSWGHFQPFINFPNSVDPGVPHLVRETQEGIGMQFVRDVDTVLTRMLRTFAIDPDKIAIFGGSYSGAMSMILGRNNPDVFSRVAALSQAGVPLDGPTPTIKTTQFFLQGGITEPGAITGAIVAAQALRSDGYPVSVIIVPQGHLILGDRPDVPAMFNWFHESWAPEAAARSARPRPVAPGPLLTADALRRWTVFWERFLAEPPSIRDTARLATLKSVRTIVGRESVTLLMMDLPALAAEYSSVAADLKAAGLTAQQAEAYRVALLSAWTTIEVQGVGEPYGPMANALVVTPTSVLGRNIAFLTAQAGLVDTLRHQKLALSDRLWTAVQ
jgi:predicted esterase